MNKERTFVAQVVGVGESFTRNVELEDGKAVPQQRITSIVAGYDDAGDNFFIRTQDVPKKFSLTDLPKVPLKTVELKFDIAYDGNRSLRTVRKQRTSNPWVDLDAQVRYRGGDPNHVVPIPQRSMATTGHGVKRAKKIA